MQELFFALFVFAGYFKAAPRLALIQTRIDVTILLAGLSFSFFIYQGVKQVRARDWALRMSRNFIRVALFFLLLTALVIGGLVQTQSQEYGFDKAARFTLLTGWAFWGTVALITNYSSLKRFSWAVVAISTAMAIGALLNQSRTAFGSSYIALARACGLGLLTVVTFLSPTEHRFLAKLGLGISAGIQLGAMLSAGARGPVFALGFSLALFFAISVRGLPSFKVDRFALRLGLVTLVAVFLIILLAPALFHTLVFRMQVLATGLGNSAITRLGFYQTALDLWASSPIWGGGTGQFSVAASGMDVRLYPHNIILELAAENGFVGVFAFLAMIGLAFGKALPRLRFEEGTAKIANKYVTTACFFALLNAMVTGDLNDNRMLFAMIALLSVSVRFRNQVEIENPRGLSGAGPARLW